MFIRGIFGQAYLYKLDLFKLMLADQTPRVLTVAACLAPKTGRISRVFDRQVLSVEDLFGVVIGDRDLGRWDQRKAAFVLDMKQVVLKLRQLVGPEQRCAIYEKRRQSLGIAVLGRVNV